MSVKGCDHVANFKSAQGVRTYQNIHSYFVVCSVPGSRSAKADFCFCHICGNTVRRLHSCLECVFFACINHIEEHFTDKQHCLSIDLIYGNVLCLECGDYVYDSELEGLRKENEKEAGNSENRQLARQSCDTKFLEKEIDKFHWKRINLTPQSALGLRGLLNLGNTCFMNCIVQVLMHTPLLRDYFLAEMHNCKKPVETCIACELSRLFQEFYKGARGPLALHHLLHLVWTNAKCLAGYEQKDAHEFFVETLDVLHRHCGPPPLEITHCNCIIDQIFTGGQQSDVVCLKCRGVSTTIEPISVISLELDSTITEATLNDILERYTRAEHLGQEIFCSNCDSYQQSTKQLTVKTLPLVVCFHFKRFELLKKIDKKITSYISFPEMLNMSPFMSQSNVAGSDVATDNRYSLFAVVNHCGLAINAGHYITYVRQQRNFWYECNDDVIRRSKLEEVLASEGYLLFYHKHVLEYE